MKYRDGGTGQLLIGAKHLGMSGITFQYHFPGTDKKDFRPDDDCPAALGSDPGLL